jgi:hypothetical protein
MGTCWQWLVVDGKKGNYPLIFCFYLDSRSIVVSSPQPSPHLRSLTHLHLQRQPHRQARPQDSTMSKTLIKSSPWFLLSLPTKTGSFSGPPLLSLVAIVFSEKSHTCNAKVPQSHTRNARERGIFFGFCERDGREAEWDGAEDPKVEVISVDFAGDPESRWSYDFGRERSKEEGERR